MRKFSVIACACAFVLLAFFSVFSTAPQAKAQPAPIAAPAPFDVIENPYCANEDLVPRIPLCGNDEYGVAVCAALCNATAEADFDNMRSVYCQALASAIEDYNDACSDAYADWLACIYAGNPNCDSIFLAARAAAWKTLDDYRINAWFTYLAAKMAIMDAAQACVNACCENWQ